MENDKRSQAVKMMAERMRTSPVPWPRTARPDSVRTITSGPPGMAVPLAYYALEREDQMETTRFQCRAYMAETADLLLNTVNCVFSAWLVPALANDRFGGSLDAFNRAYMGQPEMDGSQIPFIATQAYSTGTVRPFYQALGLHAPANNTQCNNDVMEAYRQIFKYRCQQRSEALWEAVAPEYDNAGGGLVPAFFDNPQMAMIKPSFDVGATEGIVPLSVVGTSLAVSGIGLSTVGTQQNNDYRQTDQTSFNPGGQIDHSGTNNVGIKLKNIAGTFFPDVTAELQQDGITVSLANIEMAKQTQAWARVRSQYSALSDDDMIDLLMSGVNLPTLAMAKPQLIDRKSVPFGMVQRFSSEAASLDVSATRGVAGADLTLRTPVLNTGGIVMILAEVVPEQFWERSADYHLLRTNTTRRPDRLLDEIDPQAIEVVENYHADVKHTDPTGIFGYAPLNHGFVRKRFNIGGKFHRTDPLAPFDENRNRIWASEPVDPTLSKEFYLATDLPEDIFLQQTVDNFEFSGAGDAVISGLTFIGPMLREATGDYQSIIDRVDDDRIEIPSVLEDQTETPAAPATEPVAEPAQQEEAKA